MEWLINTKHVAYASDWEHKLCSIKNVIIFLDWAKDNGTCSVNFISSSV